MACKCSEKKECESVPEKVERYRRGLGAHCDGYEVVKIGQVLPDALINQHIESAEELATITGTTQFPFIAINLVNDNIVDPIFKKLSEMYRQYQVIDCYMTVQFALFDDTPYRVQFGPLAGAVTEAQVPVMAKSPAFVDQIIQKQGTQYVELKFDMNDIAGIDTLDNDGYVVDVGEEPQRKYYTWLSVQNVLGLVDADPIAFVWKLHKTIKWSRRFQLLTDVPGTVASKRYTIDGHEVTKEEFEHYRIMSKEPAVPSLVSTRSTMSVKR